MANLICYQRFILCLLVFFAFISTTNAQPPWSRGEQQLYITFDEAMNRAQSGLEAEGFVNLQRQANFVAGYKGNSTAIIMCNNAPDGKQWINIVVMNSSDGSLPGAERVKLQQHMEGSASTNTGPTPGGTIDWYRQADQLRGKNGERFVYTCPPNGIIGGRVWGTDIYTDDSYICPCAVHAGLITTANGGTVTIEILGPQNSYQGSTRNGVSSTAYNSWYGSFFFVK